MHFFGYDWYGTGACGCGEGGLGRDGSGMEYEGREGMFSDISGAGEGRMRGREVGGDVWDEVDGREAWYE